MLSEELVSDMTREELLAEIQELKSHIEASEEHERLLKTACKFKDGQIEGLKLALRCIWGEVR